MNIFSQKNSSKESQNSTGNLPYENPKANPLINFVDNRPEGIMQRKLQSVANNFLVQTKRISSSPNNSVIQKMQLIATEKDKREDDLTILNNIAFAREINKRKGVGAEKTGSLFGDYSAADLDYEKGEIVFVHGHGLAGGFRDALSEGDIKDPGDQTGILSWDKTAQIISSKLANAEFPLTIRMLSCHGAEPSVMQFPGINPRGFVDAMADCMGKAGVEATVTAYNDPVISWGLLDGTSLKAGPKYDEWLAIFKEIVIDPVQEELNQLKDDSAFDYQARINFVRSKIKFYSIDELIQIGIKENALVANAPVTKQSDVEEHQVNL